MPALDLSVPLGRVSGVAGGGVGGPMGFFDQDLSA